MALNTPIDSMRSAMLLALFYLLSGFDSARAAPSPQPVGSDTPVDAYACEPGIVARAAKAVGFVGKGLWADGPRNACRLDPAHDDRAIVAIAYVAGEEK